MDRQVILSRQELYALVWAQPLSVLGKRYGLSTYGFRKLCIKMSIPIPRSDHWNKKRAGTAEPAPVLPAKYRGEPTVTLNLTVPDEEKENGMECEDDPLEPLVVALRSALMSNMKDMYGLNDGLVRRGTSQLDVRVAPPTIDRACLFMDKFLKTAQDRGHSIEIADKLTYLVVGTQRLQLVCREKLKRVANPDAEYSWDRTLLQPSGILAFQMPATLRPKEWIEGKKSLVQQIPAILDKLETESGKRADHEIEWALRRAKADDEERIRNEYLRRREKELSDFKDLLQEAARWRQAIMIREYLQAVEEGLNEKGGMEPALEERLVWARKKADWYDPRKEAFDEWLADVDRKTLTAKTRY